MSSTNPFTTPPPASREPRFTLAEIAERLGCKRQTLARMVGLHPGLVPVGQHHASASRSRLVLYIMSDVKAWLRTLPDDARAHFPRLKPRSKS